MNTCPHCSRKVESSWSSCAFCGKPLTMGAIGSVKHLLRGLFGASQPPAPAAPEPTRFRGDFRLEIQDVFAISGRGVVVVGVVQGDAVAVGDGVRFTSPGGVEKSATIQAIEVFRKKLDRAEPGENVGLLLNGVEKGDVAAGTVLSGSPGS